MTIPRGTPTDKRELAAIVADQGSRIHDLEVAASRRTGWAHLGTHIISAGPSRLMTLPATGLFKQIRITANGAVATEGQVYLRLNDDSTAGGHQARLVRWNGDGTLAQAVVATGTSAYVGHWTTDAGQNSLEILIHRTDESSHVPLQARSDSGGTTAGSNMVQLAAGSLEAAALLSSFRLLGPGPGSVNLVGVKVEVEGLRARTISVV